MTERGATALVRDETMLAIGPSSLTWDGDGLTIDIDEITVPFPSRIKGKIRLFPSGVVETPLSIARQGSHLWHPIAPLARVEVELERPGIAWTGRGYFDSNWGAAPLEDAFLRWDWSRSMSRDKTVVYYDTETKASDDKPLALSIARNGTVMRIEPPPMRALPRSLWRIGRNTRADESSEPRVVEALEDTPFYARSVVATRLGGEDTMLMHESVDFARFVNPVIQLMLPFRMPRRR
jgi:carotenoid 1,2-hydratase